jgi:pimeloyl-ACP methyl ester carboxylesterase
LSLREPLETINFVGLQGKVSFVKKNILKMDFIYSMQKLKTVFSYNKRIRLDDSHVDIVPFCFTQTMELKEVQSIQCALPVTDFCPFTDDCIIENKVFNYIIFAPDRKKIHKQAIILLHGLNERSWDKYLPWAEYLVEKTGKAVILFPLAFHMNRTPVQWCNPRAAMLLVNERKQKISDLHNSTFVNVVLSSRISQQPLRFYSSGLESVYNVVQLVGDIKEGRHPFFKADTSVNIFAYSVGALLSQVLLLANPERLFDDTRLFMFCGGSVFSDMNGNARDILDKEANARLHHYYQHHFCMDKQLPHSPVEDAFKMMLNAGMEQARRESFFRHAGHRIRAISLKKDTVIPACGIIKALGNAAGKILKEWDFPFPYSHQIPFPVDKRIDPALINRAFSSVFNPVAAFL